MQDQNRSVICVIMAGGFSNRMGQDKAHVKLGDHSLMDIAIRNLREASFFNIRISRNEAKTDYIQDIIPHKGPLSAIHAACVQYQENDILFLPVDLPLISAATLQKTVKKGIEDHTHVSIGDNNFPLFLKNSKHLIDLLEHQLKRSNNFSVGRFIDSIKVKCVECENNDELTNINSPEDLQKAHMLL